MKFSIVSAAVVLGIGAVPFQAFANDGLIIFKGGLEPTTCQVEGHDPGHGNADKTFDMGHLPVGEFQQPDSIGDAQEIEIRIGGNGDTSCTDGHTAYVHYNPLGNSSVSQSTGNVIPDEGGPENLEIQILNKRGQVLDLRDNARSDSVTIVNHEALIPVVARFYSKNGHATSGEFNARLSYTVEYD